MVDRSRSFNLMLAAIIALGLGLRIANAQGALWLDEAWSARLAHDVGSPLGVFLNINHDNNHHLNSIWLQLVGLEAPPVLARALSILAGSVAIGVAATIGLRRSATVALVTALLFAVSPILVTMGSEARGYMPMLLALLTALLITERWAAGETTTSPRTTLALLFLIGALFQLTIVFGFAALVGMAFLARWQAVGTRRAFVETVGVLGPAVLALFAVGTLVLGAAAASPAGMQFGNQEPFVLANLLLGLIAATTSAVGVTQVSAWWPAATLMLVLLARRAGVQRLAFARLAIIAFPLMLALVQPPNAGHARYYLLVSIALLLLLGEVIGRAMQKPDWRRGASGAVLAGIAALSLVDDLRSIANQRGDPGVAIQAMAARAPTGSTVLLDRGISEAVIDVAAAEARYPLRLQWSDCPAAPFLFVDRFGKERFRHEEVRCGIPYRPIAAARPHGLSGIYWTLYERAR